MGFFTRLIAKGPGGPAATAKAIFSAYNAFKAENPECDEKEALEYAILSRYLIYKAISEREQAIVLELSERIGDVIALLIYAENKVAFSEHLLDVTFLELANFYKRFAPQELKSLEDIPVNIGLFKVKTQNPWDLLNLNK